MHHLHWKSAVRGSHWCGIIVAHAVPSGVNAVPALAFLAIANNVNVSVSSILNISGRGLARPPRNSYPRLRGRRHGGGVRGQLRRYEIGRNRQPDVDVEWLHRIKYERLVYQPSPFSWKRRRRPAVAFFRRGGSRLPRRCGIIVHREVPHRFSNAFKRLKNGARRSSYDKTNERRSEIGLPARAAPPRVKKGHG